MTDELVDQIRSTIKSVFATTESDQIRTVLDDLGWEEMLEEDAPAATTVLFEEYGRSLSAADLLSPVVSRTLGQDHRDATVLLPHTMGAFRMTDGVVDLDAITTVAPNSGATYVLPVDHHGNPVVVALSDDELVALTVTEIGGFDPESGQRHVKGLVTVDPSRWVVAGQWLQAAAETRCAVASALVGISERMLEIAIEHVTTRSQFGQPLGTYQAVQHRLADAHVATTAARHAVETAWMDGTTQSAIVAKALAGDACSLTSIHSQQVCGAMGMTAEFGLHRYVRRGQLLDSLLGGAALARRHLGSIHLTDGLPPAADVLVAS